ncbi:MAG: hypothetical protein GEU90_08645, partial [Gemmatimonas sp.]|nr:hypothetical protein [Gemmatimonas sp.]
MLATIGMRQPRLVWMIGLVAVALAGAREVAWAQSGDAAVADWPLLAGLDHSTGEMTDDLKKLDGARVRVPG